MPSYQPAVPLVSAPQAQLSQQVSNASQQWAASLNATLQGTNFTQLLLQAATGPAQQGTSPASAAQAADAAQLAALLQSMGPGAWRAGTAEGSAVAACASGA